MLILRFRKAWWTLGFRNKFCILCGSSRIVFWNILLTVKTILVQDVSVPQQLIIWDRSQTTPSYPMNETSWGSTHLSKPVFHKFRAELFCGRSSASHTQRMQSPSRRGARHHWNPVPAGSQLSRRASPGSLSSTLGWKGLSRTTGKTLRHLTSMFKAPATLSLLH